MKELVLYLVKQLVDKPDEVQANFIEEGDTTRITLKVAEEDKGKIIGKQGKVIKALREVVSATASRANRKAMVDLE